MLVSKFGSTSNQVTYKNKILFVDVNECEQNRVCTNGVCTNLEGTYKCECNEGYDYDEENKLCLGKLADNSS